MKEEYHKAIEVYSRSMLLDSMNHRAPFLTSYSYNNYLNHGFSSMQISQYTSAITDYSLLLEKYPGVEKFYFNRGVAYANTGRIQEAKADFMESLKLDANGPNHGAGLYNLAACHVKLGDLKSALNYFRQAQSAGYPVDPAIVQNIERQVGIKRDTGK
jgi:tetratricopeptide (TPR) repeat protein